MRVTTVGRKNKSWERCLVELLQAGAVAVTGSPGASLWAKSRMGCSLPVGTS